MSAVTAFSSRIRDAGDLENDARLFGSSFRSTSKYDASKRRDSRTIELMVESASVKDFQPMRDNSGQHQHHHQPPPLPPSSSSSGTASSKSHRDGKKKRSRARNENKRSSKPIDSSAESQNESANQPNDDEFMESLRRRRSENRRRRQNNKENDDPPKIRDLNSSLNEKSENVVSSELRRKSENTESAGAKMNKGLRVRSNSLIIKNAFEDPQVDHNVSVEDDENKAIEVGILEQKRSTPRSGGRLNSTDLTSSPPSPQSTTSSHVEYYAPLLNSSTIDFVLTPAPPSSSSTSSSTIKCKIICQRGLFTEYYFYLENLNNGRDLLVMKATRRMTSTKSNYLITLINYNSMGTQFVEANSCARIVSNIYRNKFRLDLSNNLTLESNSSSNEILNVSYKSTMGEPTKIIASAGLCCPNNNGNNKNNTSQIKDKVTYFLKNRAPYFDARRKTYVLDYNGRAKKSSKHNFQIIDESRASDEILIQLGKLDTGVYSCDFAFPLCALQAFGFALSSLCR